MTLEEEIAELETDLTDAKEALRTLIKGGIISFGNEVSHYKMLSRDELRQEIRDLTIQLNLKKAKINVCV